MTNLDWILIFVIMSAGSFGVAIGVAKLSIYFENKRINRNMYRFLDGKIDNKIQMDDGRIIDVNKFILYDKDKNRKIIEFKGDGRITEDTKVSYENEIPVPKPTEEEKPVEKVVDKKATPKKKKKIKKVRVRKKVGKKGISQKQLDALARGRETRKKNLEKKKK